MNKMDVTFELIKSLTKAEKRSFKLYSRRYDANKECKFMILFDVLDAMDTYNEVKVLKSVPGISKHKLSNIKMHLYRQILVSTRLVNISKTEESELLEQYEFANILYQKGLYKQARKIVAKQILEAQMVGALEIELLFVNLDKKILSLYSDRSVNHLFESMTLSAIEISSNLKFSSRLSNGELQCYGLYLKLGHVRSERDFKLVENFFHKVMPKIKSYEKLRLDDKLSFHRAHNWYYYINQDFLSCYKHAWETLSLFKSSSVLVKRSRFQYIKAYGRVLDSLYYVLHITKYNSIMKELEEVLLENDSEMSASEQINGKSILFMAKLNNVVLEANFLKGEVLIPSVRRFVERNSAFLDDHTVLLYHYKIASIYFALGNYDKTTRELKIILGYKDIHTRRDLQCFARILNIVAIFEKGDKQELLSLEIKNTLKFLTKSNDTSELLFKVIELIEALSLRGKYDANKRLEKAFLEYIIKFYENKFQRRPFLYIDFISWIEAHIFDTSIKNVIKSKITVKGDRSYVSLLYKESKE